MSRVREGAVFAVAKRGNEPGIDPYGTPLTVIEPPKGWPAPDLRELWAHRELFGVLVARDIKVRYKQTVLGAAWVVLRPMLSAAIFTLIFGGLARIPSEGYSYGIFVFAALVPWTFFVQAVGASGNSLVGSAGLIGKVYFPRLLVPIASVAGAFVDFAVLTALLLVLLPLFGVGLGGRLLATPALALVLVLAALGVGTIFSALTVAYRDFGSLAGFLLQIWMFATPVVYPAAIVPPRWRWMLRANPMAGLVEGFRSAFLGRPFDLPALAVSFAAAAALLVAGVAYFGKVERRFADII